MLFHDIEFICEWKESKNNKWIQKKVNEDVYIHVHSNTRTHIHIRIAAAASEDVYYKLFNDLIKVRGVGFCVAIVTLVCLFLLKKATVIYY